MWNEMGENLQSILAEAGNANCFGQVSWLLQQKPFISMLAALYKPSESSKILQRLLGGGNAGKSMYESR